MFAVRTTKLHFSVSSAMCFAKSAGEPTRGGPSTSVRRLAHDRLGGGVGASAQPILDDEGLAHTFRKLSRIEPTFAMLSFEDCSHEDKFRHV
jgi:hypothetical protein